MKEKRILFLGIGRRVELIQAFRQAALVLDENVMIYGEDIDDTAPALAFCDKRITVCRIKDADYINMLLDACQKERIDLIIPTIDTNLLVLSENKERFESISSKVLVSDPSMIRICRDKNLTSQYFMECGLKAPMTVNDWKKYHSGYPAFIKPKDGSSSIDAYKVENIEGLKSLSSQIDDYIIQPFIDGTEYTVDIFADFNGKPIFIVPRVRLAVRAGEVLKTQIDLDSKIIDECKKLIDVFKPCGPMTVQLIRDKRGDDYYIEINPRFGGGVPLSMKAGARSAEILFKLLNGTKVEFSGNVINKAVYSRFDQSVCVNRDGTYLNEKRRTIDGVVFDLDDTLYSEKEYVKSGFKAVAKYLGDERYSEILWHDFKQGKKGFEALLKRIQREEELQNCIDVYRCHRPNIHLYDGVKDLITSLKQRGIRVGIITDGRPEGQRNKIKALDIEQIVEDIIITDELGGIQFRKPCDIAFRIMAIRWKLPFENMIYIGDNIMKDFQAPRQLGMKTLFRKNEDGLYYSGDCREWQITDIREILNYIG